MLVSCLKKACHVSGLFSLNHKYDVFSCLSQSDYLNTGV